MKGKNAFIVVQVMRAESLKSWRKKGGCKRWTSGTLLKI